MEFYLIDICGIIYISVLCFGKSWMGYNNDSDMLIVLEYL